MLSRLLSPLRPTTRARTARGIASACRVLASASLLWSLAWGCSFPGYEIAGVTPPGAAGDVQGGEASAGAAQGGASGGTSQDAAGQGGQAEAAAGASGESGAGGDGPEPGPLDGVYRLVTSHSKCMDADGTPTLAKHGTIQQLTCNGSNAQSFTLRHLGEDYYEISVTGTQNCVDVEGGAPENETPIVKLSCDQRPSQHWLAVPQSDATLVLVNRLTSKCLDIPGGAGSENLHLHEWSCNSSAAQRWFPASLAPKPLPVVVDQYYVASSWTGASTVQARLAPGPDWSSRDCEGNRAPQSRGNCHIIELATFPEGATTSGADWLHPVDNRGRYPGLLIAAGATRISFQARGEHGGEEIWVGARQAASGPFTSAFDILPQNITLETSWQSYSLDLTSSDYSGGVFVAIEWSLDVTINTAPLRFYVDDIVWE